MLVKPSSISWLILLRSTFSDTPVFVFERQRKMFQIVILNLKWNWKSHVFRSDLQKPSTGSKTLFARAVTAIISSICPPLYFQTFPLVKLAALRYCGPTEHVPVLLRAIALRDSTCSESTLLNALRQDYLFFFYILFVYLLFSWLLLCCWVAAAFKNNQSLYLFRKLDWFCE